eukprot:6196521-Pleurochrysis_carterae.AAC.1
MLELEGACLCLPLRLLDRPRSRLRVRTSGFSARTLLTCWTLVRGAARLKLPFKPLRAKLSAEAAWRS